jgi:hypothetical protein
VSPACSSIWIEPFTLLPPFDGTTTVSTPFSRKSGRSKCGLSVVEYDQSAE